MERKTQIERDKKGCKTQNATRERKKNRRRKGERERERERIRVVAMGK